MTRSGSGADPVPPEPGLYGAFRRVLVEPFQMAGSTGFVSAFWDWRRDNQRFPDLPQRIEALVKDVTKPVSDEA